MNFGKPLHDIQTEGVASEMVSVARIVGSVRLQTTVVKWKYMAGL
jgi:hypothetical protein